MSASRPRRRASSNMLARERRHHGAAQPDARSRHRPRSASATRSRAARAARASAASPRFGMRHAEIAGRDVDPGKRRPSPTHLGEGATSNCCAGAPRAAVLGERARRDQPHHVAPDHRLSPALARFGRVLHLLADRDAVADAISVGDILGALDRHRTSGCRAEMLAALGQHDVERARGALRVGEEHLVEIAHPVEQQAIRIGPLDLEILFHHRREAAIVAERFGRAGGGGIGDGPGSWPPADGRLRFTRAARCTTIFRA